MRSAVTSACRLIPAPLLIGTKGGGGGRSPPCPRPHGPLPVDGHTILCMAYLRWCSPAGEPISGIVLFATANETLWCKRRGAMADAVDSRVPDTLTSVLSSFFVYSEDLGPDDMATAAAARKTGRMCLSRNLGPVSPQPRVPPTGVHGVKMGKPFNLVEKVRNTRRERGWIEDGPEEERPWRSLAGPGRRQSTGYVN